MSNLKTLFSPKAVRNSRIVRTILIVMCFAMACALGNRLYARMDMTANAHHTLTPQSVETLGLFTESVEVEVFINPMDPQADTVASLFEKYQIHKTDINVTYTDPALDPQRMRKLDVAPGGEIFLRYKKRTQRLTQLSEQSLTSAMQRLARTTDHTVLFTTGHGERSIDSNTNADLGIFVRQLTDSGFNVNTINLTKQNTVDANNKTLVIAGPIHRFLANEVVLLLDYISNGGNLIWLTEPDSDDGLKPIAIELGIERLPGVVIDMAAQQLQVERPDFAVTKNYFRHQATEGFSAVTLFPQASGLNLEADRQWQVTPLVQTSEQAWTETGALTGSVKFGDDQREVRGPFPLVFALERDKSNKQQPNKQQRIVIAGDGDFLTDAWIANGGNRDLGNRLFNWSVADNTMIGIAAPAIPDAELNLTRTGMFLLAGVAFLVLPGLMFSAATGVWYRRQHG